MRSRLEARAFWQLHRCGPIADAVVLQAPSSRDAHLAGFAPSWIRADSKLFAELN